LHPYAGVGRAGNKLDTPFGTNPAAASSNDFAASKVFEPNLGNWTSASSYHDFWGYYIGSTETVTSDFGTIFGQWIELQLPFPTAFKSVRVTPNQTLLTAQTSSLRSFALLCKTADAPDAWKTTFFIFTSSDVQDWTVDSNHSHSTKM
jgi:hypothetical protein